MSAQTDPPAARGFSAKTAIKWVLFVQLAIALFLMGGDLVRVLPQLAWPSSQPRFDMPVSPGDQTRRYAPSDIPLDGNPDRPFQSTGDMPSRLAFVAEADALTITGQIAPGDAQRFTDFMNGSAAGITRVRLNSPGGSVEDALIIGQHIRDADYDTVLGAADICLSACPYILAGGVSRSVHVDGQVGVHQHYFGANTALPAFLAVEDIQRGQGRVMTYLDAMGVDPLVMQHALVTPPDEIYVLLPEELTTYQFVTP
ncbi:hypothetical protein [Yoonia sp. SS1-5]|uniref:Periplasmic protein-like protein n=1 Tax=Yoonia rhodophyticola TaxID=3137370 RepID=A0AAN0M8G3_9RHOB